MVRPPTTVSVNPLVAVPAGAVCHQHRKAKIAGAGGRATDESAGRVERHASGQGTAGNRPGVGRGSTDRRQVAEVWRARVALGSPGAVPMVSPAAIVKRE